MGRDGGGSGIDRPICRGTYSSGVLPSFYVISAPILARRVPPSRSHSRLCPARRCIGLYVLRKQTNQYQSLKLPSERAGRPGFLFPFLSFFRFSFSFFKRNGRAHRLKRLRKREEKRKIYIMERREGKKGELSRDNAHRCGRANLFPLRSSPPDSEFFQSFFPRYMPSIFISHGNQYVLIPRAIERERQKMRGERTIFFETDLMVYI